MRTLMPDARKHPCVSCCCALLLNERGYPSTPVLTHKVFKQALWIPQVLCIWEIEAKGAPHVLQIGLKRPAGIKL